MWPHPSLGEEGSGDSRRLFGRKIPAPIFFSNYMHCRYVSLILAQGHGYEAVYLS